MAGFIRMELGKNIMKCTHANLNWGQIGTTTVDYPIQSNVT
jgi:hypothetical protein